MGSLSFLIALRSSRWLRDRNSSSEYRMESSMSSAFKKKPYSYSAGSLGKNRFRFPNYRMSNYCCLHGLDVLHDLDQSRVPVAVNRVQPPLRHQLRAQRLLRT
jgi:hypothetical protein